MIDTAMFMTMTELLFTVMGILNRNSNPAIAMAQYLKLVIFLSSDNATATKCTRLLYLTYTKSPANFEKLVLEIVSDIEKVSEDSSIDKFDNIAGIIYLIFKQILVIGYSTWPVFLS